LVIDESVVGMQIPALCIQPLVENAVKHGVAQKAGPGRVRVAIRRDGQRVEISVEDTGDGFDPDRDFRPRSGSGVGFQNVRQRLKLCYGERSALRVASGPDGTTVSFAIPMAALLLTEDRSVADLVR
jgi:sensor histidine kinase YesM